MTFSDHIISFLKKLQLDVDQPHDIKVMNPFRDKAVMDICKIFYKKYYSDEYRRRLIIGINPGRFGGGLTGIPFTDPIRMQNECGIENHLPKKQELSSLFVYDVINAFGGPVKFYQKFYITSVSPLGFTKDEKNLNYYDDKKLQQDIKGFVVSCMQKQLKFPVDRDVAFCLGDGKNFSYLSKLNDEQKFFKKIVPLSHPRFIMQYRLKKKGEYVDKYLEELKRES